MTRALTQGDAVMDRVLDHARREFPGVEFDRVDGQWRATSGTTVLDADSVAGLCAALRIQQVEDQAQALAECIGRAFPPWQIWRSHGIWYATGPCPDPSCSCTRTLHAPNAGGLCQQLSAAEAGQ